MRITEKDYNLIRDYIDNPEVEISDEIKNVFFRYDIELQNFTFEKIKLGDSLIYRGKHYIIIDMSENLLAIKDEFGNTDTMKKIEFINRKKKEIFESSKNELSILKIGENKFHIPESRQKLLIITNREPQEADFGIKYTINLWGSFETIFKPEEPSAIYPFLPIKNPQDGFDIDKIKKKPSYKYLTPEQRWIYLNWLSDISQPIDINYVFLYYYGLERHLIHDFIDKLIQHDGEKTKHIDYFIPNLDLAIEEIIELRKYHNDYFFQHYSLHSVFYTLLIRKQIDKFWNFFKNTADTDVDNIKLLMALYNDSDITSEALMSFLETLRHPNFFYDRKTLLDSKYIFQRKEIFKSELECVLEEMYGSKYFPLTKYSIKDIPQTTVEVLANYSIPKEKRFQRIPNITAYPAFILELSKIMSATDEKVKKRLRSRRKNG